MNLEEYKEKVFQERPEVKEEYDMLGPQYDQIRSDIEGKKKGCKNNGVRSE